MDKYLGTVLDGRYEILEVLGTGGMSTVYKARDNRLNRLVAIKILKDDLALDGEFRRRFQTESQAVAMLSSPNIVAIYDVSKSLDVEYIVMELIEGITLKQYMNRKGRLNWKESLHFATQITRALNHAHSRGIIHRDIKPHNIMILKDGSVKVADFGIARLQDSQSSTLTQEALGSVHYISPEQAKGAQVDARSDLYSVGVVLYEMLTSRLPFEGDSAVSVAIQHISSIPLSPRDINPEIPTGLEAITMKAMNPSLNLRYQTAEEMLRDFESFRQNPNIVFPFAQAGAGFGAVPPSAQPGSGQAPRRPQQPGGANPARQNNPRRRDEDDRDERDDRDRKAQERDKNRTRNKKARRVSTMLGVGVVLLFLIVVAIFLWTTILSPIFGDAQERVEVDDFVGRHIDLVQNDPRFLEKYDFTIEHEETDAHPEGIIISQNPAADRLVAQESDGRVRMRLTVARSVNAEVMPDLFNLSYEQARVRLIEMGVPGANIHRRYQASDEVQENHVVETIPMPDVPIDPATTSFHLFISSGPDEQEVRVPQLYGFALPIAVSTLQALGLDYTTVMEHSPAANGTVIAQNVAHNTLVPPRTQIILTVSLGPEPTPTPAPTPPPVETPPTNGEDTNGDETEDER